MDSVIPEDARQFFLQHIDSIVQWEGLLLLRANQETNWDADAVARNLYVTEADAAKVLARLTAQGFVVTSGHGSSVFYRYRVALPETEAMIGQCAELYKQYLIPITHLIHSKPKTRIQKFADAFKITKD